MLPYPVISEVRIPDTLLLIFAHERAQAEATFFIFLIINSSATAAVTWTKAKSSTVKPKGGR